VPAGEICAGLSDSATFGATLKCSLLIASSHHFVEFLTVFAV